MTVNGPGGTARRMGIGAPYRIAGKTGTAQVVNRGTVAVNPKSLPLWKRHRALYIGYAPAENPTIAVAVMVEGGGYGASTAAPIARKVLDAYLLGRMPDGTRLDAMDPDGTQRVQVGAPQPGPANSPTLNLPAANPPAPIVDPAPRP